jgi:uncharacterized protein
MKIIISPAKTIKTDIKYDYDKKSVPVFIKESEYLVSKLKKYSVKQLVNLFNVSNEIAETNQLRFQNWTSEINSSELLPCAFAFNGEVYRGLNINEMNKVELDYLDQNLRILSGLYGVLNPFDFIFPYRLEMGTKINLTTKINNLYQYWDEKITNLINSEEDNEIVNLASTEYFKVLQPKKIKAKIITPIFKEFKNGEFKMIMTYAKHARGEMVNYAAKNNIKESENLKNFNHLGYSYNDKFSNENEWVFVR